MIANEEDALEATEELAERRRDQLVIISSTIMFGDRDKKASSFYN